MYILHYYLHFSKKNMRRFIHFSISIVDGCSRPEKFKKISAIEIPFFDDAYSFDSSVFIGLYLHFFKFLLVHFLGFNYCFLWTIPPFINLCSAHVLGFSCCLLWSVPPFLQIYQGCLIRSLDYPSVCFLYMRSVLSSSVHRTVPPMFGFHHMYFVLSSSVHWTVPPWCRSSSSGSSMLNL